MLMVVVSRVCGSAVVECVAHDLGSGTLVKGSKLGRSYAGGWLAFNWVLRISRYLADA